MKRRLLPGGMLLLAAGMACAETAKPPDPKPGEPLSIVMGTRKPLRIRVARNQATLIRLPEGQRVMNVYGGDKGEGGVWSVDSGKIPTRFLAVKPREAGIRTTLHVISNTGEEISFFLEEVTGQDIQFDAEVDAESSNTAKGSTPVVPEVKWVPAEDVASCKTHADALQRDLSEAERKSQEKADAAINAFEAQYPKKLHFDFTWDQAKAEKLGLQVGWSDDKFTYFRGSRVLALYEIDEDGKASLIKYGYSDGLYTVPKLLYDGYFAIGPKKENKLTFHRERSRS